MTGVDLNSPGEKSGVVVENVITAAICLEAGSGD